MDIAFSNVDFCESPSWSDESPRFTMLSDAEALEDVIRRYGNMVFRVCLGVTRHRHDAEDVTQSVFLNLARRGGWAGQIRRMGPWLQRVAYRLSLDLRRSGRRRRLREERHVVDLKRHEVLEESTEGSSDVAEFRPALMQELNRLPARYRSPLVMFYFEGMSREQMARQLSCNASTLGVQLHRARRMLAARLAARHPDRFAQQRSSAA